MTPWRISSSTNQNLVTALEAGRWGSNRKAEIGQLAVGDQLAFYCSLERKLGGYAAIGVVTEEVFIEHERLWLDDVYPFRIRFDLTLGPVEPRVPRQELTNALGGARLTYLKQAAIIKLADEEYQAIAKLLGTAESS